MIEFNLTMLEAAALHEALTIGHNNAALMRAKDRLRHIRGQQLYIPALKRLYARLETKLVSKKFQIEVLSETTNT